MTRTAADAPPTEEAFDPALRRLAVAVVMGAIMTILDSTIVNVAVNTLGRDFHTSLSTIQWVLTGYLLALSMTIPLTGWAMERFGAKTMWITSLALFIAGSVLCGAAWNTASLIVFRILQGVGGGLLMPIGQTLLAGAAGPRRMGRVMSLISIPAMLAPVLGPVLGGLIVGHLSWRWMFYVNVPFCAVALLLALRWIPADSAHRARGRLDTLGLALLSPGLAALVYGLSEAGNGSPLTGVRVLGSVGAGVVLLCLFCAHALRKADGPLLDLRIFRDRGFTTALAAMFVYSGAVFGLTVLLPLYFQIAQGESPTRAGLLVAPFGIGAIITMAFAGRVADRRGSRGLGVLGIAVATAAALVLTQIDTTTSQALLVATTFAVGLGHGLIVAPVMAALYRTLPRAAMPAATTTANILVRVGSSLGTAMLAVVLQIYIRAEIPGASGSLADAAKDRSPGAVEALVRAFAHSFWWTAGLAALALIPALLLPGRASDGGGERPASA
ncbi:DHA2 family efflux MFS transporter permease subunit [Actinomadura sp. HBU206391]|uniref:DHA2 family efflux MFS transporter permease subunit n=1 Tax=Actinomadura sp. HBU206391 TaxID=2731692 RepID=UPI00164FBB69|nr:DHA2 family efflux MFS transporter permease subunit [Actinomadura sp. HBU206391]MBC6460987.1 DHA2 family efflux MFS transporter permease subunit [Actinomadura sp. HBU206391]